MYTKNLLEFASRSYLYLLISYIAARMRLIVSTKIKGAIADMGESGDIAGMNCSTAVTKKYTLADLLN